MQSTKIGIICFLLGLLVLLFNPLISILFFIATSILAAIGMMQSKNQKNNNDTVHPIQTNGRQKLTYIINPQTMVIHRPDCRYAKAAYSFNTRRTNSLQDALDVGYKRCQRCNPR